MEGVNSVVSGIAYMGSLLKDITSKSMGLEEKMMQQNVIEKVSNASIGQNIDITA